MSKFFYHVTEDNGGTLGLFVRDKSGRVLFAHFGYEHCPGQLSADIAALSEPGCDPESWDGNVDEWLRKAYLKEMMGDMRVDIIADWEGIYYDVMGGAGRVEFGDPKNPMPWIKCNSKNNPYALGA